MQSLSQHLPIKPKDSLGNRGQKAQRVCSSPFSESLSTELAASPQVPYSFPPLAHETPELVGATAVKRGGGLYLICLPVQWPGFLRAKAQKVRE